MYAKFFVCANGGEPKGERMAKWLIAGRPRYLGKHREEKFKEWDSKYGKGRWRLVWQVGATFVDFIGACALYEDAYFEFLKNNPEVLFRLIEEAQDVYDTKESNVSSGFDYTKQEDSKTHIQDIAIRRSLIRMFKWFCGRELIRIRQEEGNHPLSMTLSPGRVYFHVPSFIVLPELTGWWIPGSVESFYQSNKFLQVLVEE